MLDAVINVCVEVMLSAVMLTTTVALLLACVFALATVVSYFWE